jgi:hypothetical protein
MKHTCLTLLSLFLISCVSDFNAVLPPQNSNILTVDGNIIGDSTVVFSLNTTFYFNESISHPEI